MQEHANMVGSYLICDKCGCFGPPAGFLSKSGLRLCYACWHEEQIECTFGEPAAVSTCSSRATDRAGCARACGLGGTGASAQRRTVRVPRQARQAVWPGTTHGPMTTEWW